MGAPIKSGAHTKTPYSLGGLSSPIPSTQHRKQVQAQQEEARDAAARAHTAEQRAAEKLKQAQVAEAALQKQQLELLVCWWYVGGPVLVSTMLIDTGVDGCFFPTFFHFSPLFFCFCPWTSLQLGLPPCSPCSNSPHTIPIQSPYNPHTIPIQFP